MHQPTTGPAPAAGATEPSPAQPGLMQKNEKQKQDLATLLSLAAGAGMKVEDGPPGPEAAALGDDETDPEAEAALAALGGGGSPQAPSPGPRVGVPDWFHMPKGMELEPGTRVAFLRLRAAHTAKPALGERQCLLVPLTVKLEGFAYKQAQGMPSSGVVGVLAKWQIAVIDGERPEWVNKQSPRHLDQFWNDIGAAYRRLIESWYVKTHVLAKEDRLDFFANCLDDRTVG
jgi:hypothetical protein